MTPFTIRTSLAALAFVACGTGAALAQDSPSPILDSVRVRQLVASEAPADQAALAAHFTALADRHASAGRLHDAMGQYAAGNPRGNGQEMKAHCQRLAGLERKASATLRELAAHHVALGRRVRVDGACERGEVPGGRRGARAERGRHERAGRPGCDAGRPPRAAGLFQTFAKRYEAEANGHVGMATLYRTTSRLAPVANHCDRLVKELRDAAAEATQAATMHGLLARPN